MRGPRFDAVEVGGEIAFWNCPAGGGRPARAMAKQQIWHREFIAHHILPIAKALAQKSHGAVEIVAARFLDILDA